MDVTNLKPGERGEMRRRPYRGARLTRHENVSISVYDDGTRVATRAQWDPSSNRMRFTQLSEPRVPADCPHLTEWMLADAAAEVLEDAHLDQPHM